MRELSLDPDKCQGHAMCYLIAPDLFDVDEEGRGVVIEPVLDGSREAEAFIAADRCPERAITVGEV
jgi:ferredoxin